MVNEYPIPRKPKSGSVRLCVALCLIIAALYAPSLRAPFLVNWDDGAFILNNPRMEWSWQNAAYYLTHPFQNLYTPTPMLSLMADVAVFGQNPVGYRIHNLGAHLLAALLLFAILRKLRVPPWGAFFGALLWAIHPQRVESVAWIVERKDLACALFGSLAVFAYLQGRESRRPWAWQILCVLAATISLGGKPASAALPAIFLLLEVGLAYDGNADDCNNPWRKIVRNAAFPGIGSFCAVLFVLFMTKQDNSGQFERALHIPAHNLGWYPITALLPLPPLNPIYPALHGWQDAAPWLLGGLLLLAGLVLLSRKLHRTWWPGIIAALLLLCTMVPVLGFLRYTDFDYCDRYNHIVSMVLWGSLAVLFGNWLLIRRRRRLALAGLTVFAVVEGVTTLSYHQTVWQSDETVAIYCLTRPGEPNLKTLELSLATGFSHANPDLLAATASAYANYPDLRQVDGRPVPEILRDALTLALTAHETFLRGDRAEADRLLRRLPPELLEDLAPHSPSLRYAAEFLYRDLAAIAADRRDKEAALRYLELEAKYLSPNPDHPATQQNRLLRRMLAQ